MRKVLHLAALMILATTAWSQQAFFEPPRLFTDENTRFPQLVSNDEFAVAAYQRITQSGDVPGTIEVLVQVSTDGLSWSAPRIVARGIRYEGTTVPPVHTIAVSNDGEILLATVDYDQFATRGGTSIVRVLRSRDRAASFQEVHTIFGDISLVSPRVFAAAGGGWFLTMERFDTPSNRIVYTHSADGDAWRELVAIPADVLQTGTQSDAEHVAIGDRDVLLFVGENIVPPAVQPGEPEIPDVPQIYAIYTDDAGQTWSATDPESGASIPGLPGIGLGEDVDFVELAQAGLVIPHRYLRVLHLGAPALGALAYQDIVMRRPAVEVSGASRILAFEAGLRLATDSVRQVAVTSIAESGNISGEVDVLSALSLRRGDARIAHNQPTPAVASGEVFVVAYQDPSRGGRVVLYARELADPDARWREISPTPVGVATYPAAATIAGRVHFFWHRRTGANPDLPTRIVYLEPDQRALPPIVAGENFQLGRRSRASTAAFRWDPAEDAAGIAGYSFVWSRNPEARVPTEDAVATRSASFTANEDGPWYLRIRALDRAGNWSPPATFEYFRDTTPPGRVTFEPPRLDEDGYLVSNTFTLRWKPPPDDVIGGYFTDLVFVADEDAEISPEDLPLVEPPQRAPIDQPAVSRDNYDNGLWALTVAAVDSVGNVGPPAVLYVRMNKYIPVTEIDTIVAVPDPLGRYTMNIIGRGFTANGVISRVVLDRDRAAPFDYVFERGSPGYAIFNDRAMNGPLLDNLATGDYFVGLVHTERGLEFSPTRLSIQRNGTVKFGGFTVIPGIEVSVPEFGVGVFSGVSALAWIVMALMLAVALVSGTRLVAIGREAVYLRLEAKALVERRPGLLEQRAKEVQEMRKQGIGLRLKFAFFVVLLVMAVVAMVAVGLGSATLNTQQLVLQRGLKERVDVLLESMATSASDPLIEPDINTLDLDAIPASTRAMDEALYATITGRRSEIQAENLPPSFNYIWGTNDPVVLAVGVTDQQARDDLLESRAAEGIERAIIPAGEPLDRGRTRIEDPVDEKIEVLGALVDLLATSRLNALVKQRELSFARSDELRREINSTIAAGGDVTELQQERQRVELTLASQNRQIEDGMEQVVLDALALVRAAELAAIGSPHPDDEARRLAVAEAVYVIPSSVEAIEADVAEARDRLEAAPLFARQLDNPVKSFPIFDPTEFNRDLRDYLFYQVVAEPDVSIFPFGATPEEIDRIDVDLAGLTYFRGTVRMGVATDLIVQAIDAAQADIIRITLLIALAAIGSGVAGAILLATIVVIPINKLVEGVEYIRRTTDKSSLKGHQIEVKTRDELFRLADSINTMTVALAAAAEAEKDLIVTSDLQKKFIPLVGVTEEGKDRKLTMAHLDVAGAEFHGYYEGADALSGDYFTYEWVDAPPEQGGSKYAMIKCDVSGHGVNAAFIMVEVATVFLNRVREWRRSTRQPRLADLVTTINDLLVERGFQNMFAAMTIALVDTSSGRIRMTHGGDTEQRIYRAVNGRIEEFELNRNAPATGMFGRDFFPAGIPFEEFTQQLNPGDIMIMATDGIEESARRIRDDQFEPIRIDDEEFARLEEEAASLDPPSNVDVDKNTRIATEEFSTKRMIRIIEQVQAQGSFRLERVRNYDADEELVFNYRGLEPSAENTVLAVMAAEKVFRLTPDLSVDDPVRVDREIDEFLKKHFSGYRRYFGYRVPDDRRPDASEKFPRSEYVYYTHLREEDQGDDLTILAIRKK